MNLSGLGNEVSEKRNNIPKILLILIAIISVIIIIIVGGIIYIQQTAFRIYIDGKVVNLPKDTIIIEETGKIYISIKDIAEYLGYKYHNGEYKLYSEDVNKGYVDCNSETASFFLNSNKISKVVPDQTRDYEDYIIEDPVISRNGKLYCSPEGVKIGFNVTFTYNKEKNIQIFTLPYLITYYETAMSKQGYEKISELTFENQKAILYGMFVVKHPNALYGVITNDNKEIISPKYKNMQFNENAREFYVMDTTNKVGIVTEDGRTKINLLYDEIEMLDKQTGLYLVQSNKKYGVLGNTGNIVIHLEYDQIGVDTVKFQNNNIKNKYLLLDNIIPVYRNKKWGLFDKTGKLLVDTEIDIMGYNYSNQGNITGKVVNNLLIIPSYKAIVVGKTFDKINRYAIYDYEGNQIIPYALDSAYSITDAGVETYYMENNNKVINIEQYIEELYKRTGKKKPTDVATN